MQASVSHTEEVIAMHFNDIKDIPGMLPPAERLTNWVDEHLAGKTGKRVAVFKVGDVFMDAFEFTRHVAVAEGLVTDVTRMPKNYNGHMLVLGQLGYRLGTITKARMDDPTEWKDGPGGRWFRPDGTEIS
jgi:hypothetical protein